jgi:hypothetical protein
MRKRITGILVVIAVVVGALLWLLNTQSSDASTASVNCTVEIVEERGYKGVVIVSDELGEIARWSSADEYVIAAAASNNAETVSVITLSGAGSKLRVFDMKVGSGEELGRFVSRDELFYELGYLSESKLFAVSKSNVRIFNINAEEISAFEFEGKTLVDVAAEEGRLTVTLESVEAGGSVQSAAFNGREWSEVKT